jgi:hypothetical protein
MDMLSPVYDYPIPALRAGSCFLNLVADGRPSGRPGLGVDELASGCHGQFDAESNVTWHPRVYPDFGFGSYGLPSDAGTLS